jgi:ADP-ribosylglycohydrolase
MDGVGAGGDLDAVAVLTAAVAGLAPDERAIASRSRPMNSIAHTG